MDIGLAELLVDTWEWIWGGSIEMNHNMTFLFYVYSNEAIISVHTPAGFENSCVQTSDVSFL